MNTLQQHAERWYADAYAKGRPLRRYSDAPNPWLVEFAASRLCPAHATIADFACGEGIDAAYMATRGHHVIGFDLAAAAIAKARAVANDRHVAHLCQFYVADMCRSGLAGNSCDIALAIACMGWLLDDASRTAFIAELARVLRPGGLLLFNNGVSLEEIATSFPDVHATLAQSPNFAAWQAEERTRAWRPPSQRYDTRDAYTRQLESAGLRVIHLHLDISPDAWGIVFWARKA